MKPRAPLYGAYVCPDQETAKERAAELRGPGISVRTYRREIRADGLRIQVWIVVARS